MVFFLIYSILIFYFFFSILERGDFVMYELAIALKKTDLEHENEEHYLRWLRNLEDVEEFYGKKVTELKVREYKCIVAPKNRLQTNHTIKFFIPSYMKDCLRNF